MKHQLLFIAFFLSIFINAQDFQGYAVYQSKSSFDMKLDSTKFSKEQQDRMKAMMKRFGEKTYVLAFNKSESIYKEEEKIEKPGQGGARMFGSFNSGTLYKDLKGKRYINQIESFSKLFLIKDSLPEYQWKFEEESKMIGDYLCFKATTTKEMSNNRMRRPRRGRIEAESKEKDSLPKTKLIDVTAWYTPDIPINNGPQNYPGLPGLILELNVGKTTLLCNKIVLNSKEDLEIKEPTKGKEVTQKEFDEITEKKSKEMMEMYGGGRNKGSGTRTISIHR